MAKTRVLAESFGGRAVPFENLYETADHADIILTSTGAPEPIFRREHGERLLKGRRNRPVFFIDIAVPRNVHPEVNKLDNLFVYDVDDLQSVSSNNSAERKKEAERAEHVHGNRRGHRWETHDAKELFAPAHRVCRDVDVPAAYACRVLRQAQPFVAVAQRR